jgi:hypothetical protein
MTAGRWTLRGSLVCLVACGGAAGTGTSGTGGSDAGQVATTQVQGQVNGRSFDAEDAISALVDQTNGFEFLGTVPFVEITDFPGACALSAQNEGPADSRVLLLGFGVNDASGKSTAPVAPATFAVHDDSAPLPPSANVAQVYYGSGCGTAVSYFGTSGTVTLTKIDADNTYEGGFDVVLSCAGFSTCSGGDAHLTGSFRSTACGALATSINITPACM